MTGNWLDRDYWKFGIDEMVEYDTPAVIEYVLNAARKGMSIKKVDRIDQIGISPDYLVYWRWNRLPQVLHPHEGV